jgi:hypothetical protein
MLKQLPAKGYSIDVTCRNQLAGQPKFTGFGD